jgi:hypothetical protein
MKSSKPPIGEVTRTTPLPPGLQIVTVKLAEPIQGKPFETYACADDDLSRTSDDPARAADEAAAFKQHDDLVEYAARRRQPAATPENVVSLSDRASLERFKRMGDAWKQFHDDIEAACNRYYAVHHDPFQVVEMLAAELATIADNCNVTQLSLLQCVADAIEGYFGSGAQGSNVKEVRELSENFDCLWTYDDEKEA